MANGKCSEGVSRNANAPVFTRYEELDFDGAMAILCDRNGLKIYLNSNEGLAAYENLGLCFPAHAAPFSAGRWFFTCLRYIGSGSAVQLRSIQVAALAQ